MATISRYIVIGGMIFSSLFGTGQVVLEPVCAETREIYRVNGYAESEFVWSVEGGEVIFGDGTDSVVIEWGYNTGNYRIEVLEITNQGCTDAPSEATIEVRAPDVNLGYDFYELCIGDSIVLEAGIHYDEPYEILWSDGSFGQYYIGRESENIWLRVLDGNNCVRYDSLMLMVYDLPEVHLGNDTLLCDFANPLELDAGNFTFYEWNTLNDEYYYNPIYLYPTELLTDTVIVRVTDNNNCSNSDTLILLPCDITGLFKEMPNTITPNNDGDNDVWNIPYMDLFPDAELEIYSRSGRMVFRSENVFEEPWDGTWNGRPLPMDSYYYVLNLNFLQVEMMSGVVNIVR